MSRSSGVTAAQPTPAARSFSRTPLRCRGSVPAVLLTITTTGKVTLLIVAGLFIAWALITAIWIPKRNPDFPATLTVFLLVSSLFLVAQLGAVYWVTSTQEVETEAAEPPGESDAGRDDARRDESREPTAGRRRATSSPARKSSSPPAASGATRWPMPERPGPSARTSTRPSRRPTSSSPASRTGWARCRRSRGS